MGAQGRQPGLVGGGVSDRSFKWKTRDVERWVLGIALVLLTPALRSAPLAQPEDVARMLERQTQELLNAVSAGNANVWDRYLDEGVIYLAEDGVRKTKADLLKEIAPLPKGISGSITVTAFEVRLHGDTAVTTHNDLESLAAARLDEYVGVYRLTSEITYTIRRQGDELTGERSGRSSQVLSVEAVDVVFVAGQPRSRKIFLRAPDGRVTGFVDRREGRDIPWTRISSDPL
jgi:hypothetical protein